MPSPIWRRYSDPRPAVSTSTKPTRAAPGTHPATGTPARTVHRRLPRHGLQRGDPGPAGCQHPADRCVRIPEALPEFQRADPLRPASVGNTSERATGRRARRTPPPPRHPLPVAGPAAVPGALQATWTDLAPHLRVGASATELSRATGRTIQDLQISLYHLRAAALIGPVRSAESLTPPTTQANGQAERQAGHMTDPAPAAQPTLTASAPIINRLLGALRRLTGARA